jgi:membrane-associated protease RseP (regulator of RpoE activity)
MDVQSIAGIVFLIMLAITLYVTRKKLTLQKIFFPFLYVVMYRTQLGIKSMEKLARKLPGTIKYLGYAGIAVGFAGMGFITYALLDNLYKIMFVPTALSGVGVVQPFSKNIPGTFFVPFFYFIISIFVLVVVHEFSHGVLAKRYKLHIKSSGFAFLGVLIPLLPAAFVEPDEKELVKCPARQQLSIFAAGPFSNVLTAILVIGILVFVMNPVMATMIDEKGVVITDFMQQEGVTFPAEQEGIVKGSLVTALDDTPIHSLKGFSEYLEDKKPGDTVRVVTNVSSYPVTLVANPEDTSKSYLGVYVAPKTELKESFVAQYGEFIPKSVMWIGGLLIWLYVLNLGIGLFNLIPLPITDGGRMMQLVLKKYLSPLKAAQGWKFISMFFFFLVIVNLVGGFVK